MDSPKTSRRLTPTAEHALLNPLVNGRAELSWAFPSKRDVSWQAQSFVPWNPPRRNTTYQTTMGVAARPRVRITEKRLTSTERNCAAGKASAKESFGTSGGADCALCARPRM